ncbi:MAG TPA: energy-coupling factor transporter transmembrane component T [Chloroflexota bacterium]|nr:energy-coupling factor transporter transmembrane component T [Chloroflexota bacterium]
MAESQVTSAGYLARRNPTVKAAVALLLSVFLLLAIDPATPLLFLAATLVAGIALGRVPPGQYARAFVPLVLIGLGFVWTNALFATAGPGDTFWPVGPLRVSARGLAFGIAIALRGVAIGALSLTFVLTTDPTGLVVSLVRHARLPFRIGYALLAGYRFLPFLAEEYQQVRLAHRLRGLTLDQSPGARLGAPLRLAFPLLAGAARRAARIGVAMDSRGFSAADGRTRTTLRHVPFGAADALFAVLCLAVAAGLFSLSAAAGWLRLWDGRFAA